MSMSSSLLCYGLLSIGGLSILILILKSHRFFKLIFFNLFQGCGALIATSLIGTLIGISLPINIFTICFSCMTGLPGVILLLVLNLIF